MGNNGAVRLICYPRWRALIIADSYRDREQSVPKSNKAIL
jgi:hypothetical protein